MAASVDVVDLEHAYGAHRVVRGISFSLAPGRIGCLLGPSGCGKTTVLRCLAGFEPLRAGTVALGGRIVATAVASEPTERRGVGMVFQDFALFPHLDVHDNVAFGLAGRPVADVAARVDAMLALVGLADAARAWPHELSGGQQQRVALARALVIQPTVLLLDEPLSNLDAKLRLEMRSEIRRICKASGITGVYVTHDQKEALSMADRMAVLRAGRIVQVGGPRELYEHPRTRFVADFLGETNFLDATVRGVDGEFLLLDTPAGVLRSPAARGNPGVGKRVTCSIRPETWRLLRPPAASVSGNGQNASAGKLTNTTYLGEVAQHIVALGPEISVRVLELNPGLQQRQASHNDVRITVNPDDVVILDD